MKSVRHSGVTISIHLPSIFNEDKETSKFLARMKRRVSKDFGWSRTRSLEDAMYLAYWLHVFGKDHQALNVCEFLGEAQFTGDTRLWTWIEGSLALQSRLLRSRDRHTEAAARVERIRLIMERTFSPGVPEKRSAGEFLKRYEQAAADAIDQSSKANERYARLMILKETCTLIELGGSPILTVADLENQYQESLRRLKEIA